MTPQKRPSDNERERVNGAVALLNLRAVDLGFRHDGVFGTVSVHSEDHVQQSVIVVLVRDRQSLPATAVVFVCSFICFGY